MARITPRQFSRDGGHKPAGGGSFDDYDGTYSDSQAIAELLRRGYSIDRIKELAASGALQSTVAKSPTGLVNGANAIKSLIGPFSSRQTVGGTPTVGSGPGIAGKAIQMITRGVAAARNGANAIGLTSQAGKSGAAGKQGRVAATLGAGVAGPSASDFMPSNYTAPILSRRDFTDQANALAAQAYGPMYAALEKGKENARGQYNSSDQVVAGLYERLGQEIAAATEKQKASYSSAGQAASDRYAALQAQIGQNYQAAADQEAAMLQAQGLQAAAGDVIPDDRAFAQNQAATAGTAQQDYYAKQGQAEQDYLGKLAVAGSTEGNVQRQNLVRDLSNILNQYDQQNLELQGQQSSTALDIANRLSDQDFQVQQANAGLASDAWNMNTNANLGYAQLQNQVGQQNYQRQRDTVSDSQWNRQQDLAENQFRLDAASAVANAQGEAGGLKFNELPPQQQVVAQGDQLTGGQGQAYFDFINQFMQDQLNANYAAADTFNAQRFSSEVAKAASARGLNPAIAMALAGSYWNRIMNRS